MDDFAKMLREHAASDHKRGCMGRQYSCSCGHDLATDQRMLEAADHVDAMDKLLAEAADYLNTHPGMDGMDLGNKITQFRRLMQAVVETRK